jgi:phenylacetate-coenzyme A ligase PaaK-like adenylate-forming protein
MVEGGAARIGCTVIPAGAGQTEMQVQAIAGLRPDTYVGTPSFLRIIIEKAREIGADISSVKQALMGAEARGRADQTTKVRAMFVHPAQVLNITRRHPDITKARLVVSGRMANDVMTLHCEVAQPLAREQIDAIIASIRDVTKLRGEVKLEAPGALPDDGKLIEDRRDYT